MALTSPTSKRRDSDPSAAITVKAVTPLWLHVGPAEKCGPWPMPPLRFCAAAGCCPKLYLCKNWTLSTYLWITGVSRFCAALGVVLSAAAAIMPT